MRSKTFAAACLLLLCACAEAAAQTASRPTTPLKLPQRTSSGTVLICRMGGQMVWTLSSQYTWMQTQLNGESVRVPVLFGSISKLSFVKSTVAAKPDASNLQPGVCGLSDRAMTATDPDNVFYNDVNGFSLVSAKQWVNDSLVEKTFMEGDEVWRFPNKQPFSVEVKLYGGNSWQVVAGTKPKAL